MTASDSLQSWLYYECLLFHCDWLGSDLRIGHFFSFRCPHSTAEHSTSEFSYDVIIELPYESITTPLMNELYGTELTSRQTEYRSPSPTVHVLLCFIRYRECVFCEQLTSNRLLLLLIAAGNMLPKRCLAIVLFRLCSLLLERVFGEPLASNGLPLCRQASCHNIMCKGVYKAGNLLRVSQLM
jgi:hypothetical protein